MALQLHGDQRGEADDRRQDERRLGEPLAVAKRATAGAVGRRRQRAHRRQRDGGREGAMVEQEDSLVKRVLVEQRRPAADGQRQHDEPPEPHRSRAEPQPAPDDRQPLHAPRDHEAVLGIATPSFWLGIMSLILVLSTR